MSRKAYCPACSAQEHGVKTRIPLEHTCGLEIGEIDPYNKPIDEPSYRGPAHRCKACENEAKGIKHIKAEKHTCRNKNK